MTDPVIDHWYRATYYDGLAERTIRGTYKGLVTWTDLPDHKFRAPQPAPGPDVEHHWFQMPDNPAVGILPENLLEASEEIPPTDY